MADKDPFHFYWTSIVIVLCLTITINVAIRSYCDYLKFQRKEVFIEQIELILNNKLSNERLLDDL